MLRDENDTQATVDGTDLLIWIIGPQGGECSIEAHLTEADALAKAADYDLDQGVDDGDINCNHVWPMSAQDWANKTEGAEKPAEYLSNYWDLDV